MFNTHNLDYRTMFNVVIGPILKYFGFILNTDGIIQKEDGSISITLSGKHLYVPENGDDYFRTKDSTLLVPFNPFKIREHILIISNFLCKVLSNHFRDEDDEAEYNGAGELLDIVTLVKRGPRNEDKLPATFRGVIYEIWCRDDEVLGKGIDEDGNDIKAILMAMLDVLSKHTHLVPKDVNYTRIFNYITKVEDNRELEAEEARAKYSTNNTNVDLSETLGDVELDVDEEPLSKEEENCDDDDTWEESESTRRIYGIDSAFDDVEF